MRTGTQTKMPIITQLFVNYYGLFPLADGTCRKFSVNHPLIFDSLLKKDYGFSVLRIFIFIQC